MYQENAIPPVNASSTTTIVARMATRALLNREAPFLEKRGGFARNAGGHQQSHVPDRERDEPRRARQARFAHRDRAVVVAIERREEMTEAHGSRAGDDAELPVDFPAPRTL